MLSAVAAETVEKAAEVPRAGGGGGGGRWRGGRASSEWSSPAGLSRAHRRELRMGGGRRQERGKACNGLQYWCARSRSPFACRLVSTHVEPEFLRGGG